MEEAQENTTIDCSDSGAVIPNSSNMEAAHDIPDVGMEQDVKTDLPSGSKKCFVGTLSSGKDPAKLEYNQVQFREHYLECLRKGVISPFPQDTVMTIPKKPSFRKFAVYCLCRLPNTGDSMVQCFKCKEWFHFTCIGLNEDATLPEEWHCTVCTNV